MDKFYSASERALIKQHRKAAQLKARAAIKARGVKIDPRIAERSMTGFVATLTPEQRERALAYRGPDNHGSPNLPRRAK